MASEETDTNTLESNTAKESESIAEKNSKEDVKDSNSNLTVEVEKDEAESTSNETALENTNRGSNSLKDPNFDKDKQQENIRTENGQYIYTDANTKTEYIWSDEKKEWIPRNQPVFDGTNYSYTDSNNIKYIWNSTSNAWEKAEAQDEPTQATPDLSKNTQYGFDGVHHTYTDPKDNTIYIWDKDKNAWFPKVDDDFLAHYQMSYGFVDNTKEEDEKKAKEIEAKEKEKEAGANKRKAAPQEPTWFELDEEHNTKVYVSNLPLDLTEQEFVDLMQKCGLVMKDVSTNKWKIKLYTEPVTKAFKGDALCSYIKRESVELALSVLDGYEFKGKKIEVQRAKFQMKGEYNPALKPKKKKKKEKEREKKIQQKLFDWRPDKLRGERESHERTVIIKNLFDPKIFDDNVELILEYTQDLREECSKCGIIRKLTLHDKHPEGVAQITFSDAEEADLCIKLLNNRWFGQRKITAETWDGKTKYKVAENEEEVKQRLEKWNKYLESEKKEEEMK